MWHSVIHGASKTGPVMFWLIVIFPPKIAKTHSQYLNHTYSERDCGVNGRNVTQYLEWGARIDCTSVFVFKFAINLICNCDKIT